MKQRFCNGMIHVIKEGENLYQLSRMHQVPLALILRANPYVDVYNLQPGQEICIPTVRRPFGMMTPPGARPQVPPSPTPPAPEPPQGMMSSDGARTPEGAAEVPSETNYAEYEPETIAEEEVVEEVAAEYMDVEKVADGTKSLKDICEENEITMEEFLAANDPSRIIVAADVTYQLPKKV
jgi:LysM repeat protein